MVKNGEQYPRHREPIVSIKALWYLWQHSNNFFPHLHSSIIKS